MTHSSLPIAAVDEAPTVDVTIYLATDIKATVHDCAVEVDAGIVRLTVCPRDLEPTAAEVDTFERLVDAMLEVRANMRDTFRADR